MVAVDVNAEAARETCEIIRGEGGNALPFAADITKASDIAAAIDEARRAFGRIDILHNNVGVALMEDLDALDEAQWRKGLDLNLTGTYLACRQVLAVMVEQKSGAIVNVSSTASLQINKHPYFSYYAAKAAVNQLTRALAVHYAPHGIRANAVVPGVMDTPLIYRQIAGEYAGVEDMQRARNAASPLGRMGTAWDVAHAALFLASDEAQYITGVCLPVDGGKSCVGR